MMLAVCIMPIVMAQSSEVISTTVTSTSVSVELDRTSVNYGIMGPDEEELDPSGSITATNNGTEPIRLLFSGSDAVSSGGTNWTLSESTGTDGYVHSVIYSEEVETQLTTSGQVIFSYIGIEEDRYFSLKIYTPTNITDTGSTFTTTVTVTAVAAEE
ncbi:MAG: hypothetical protein SVM80_08860 [Halobacteriota archaeon]|nr:hypothetical protein [Halobacteriota archaeon]